MSINDRLYLNNLYKIKFELMERESELKKNSEFLQENAIEMLARKDQSLIEIRSQLIKIDSLIDSYLQLIVKEK